MKSFFPGLPRLDSGSLPGVRFAPRRFAPFGPFTGAIASDPVNRPEKLKINTFGGMIRGGLRFGMSCQSPVLFEAIQSWSLIRNLSLLRERQMGESLRG